MPSIKKNYAYQTAYQLLMIILPLILAPYISRVLGAENIGIYSYTDSVAKYFVMFAMLGINHLGSRTVAADRDDKKQLNKTFSNLFFLHLIISALIIIAYAIYIIFFVREYRFLFTMQMFLVLSSVFDITWLFTGLEQFKITVIRNAAVKILTVGFIFIFVKDKDDLWLYILIWALGTLASQLSVWFFLRRFIAFVKPSLKEMKAYVKPMLILFIPIAAMSIYNIMDKIMLGVMTDKIQLGFYENSEKIIFIPIGFITAFNAVMIPRMSNLNVTGTVKQKKSLTFLSMKYIMLLTFALTFGIASIAEDFSPLFFGSEFKDCGQLIIVLCIIIPFLAFQNVITAQYLIPNSKDTAYTVSTLAGAVVNVVSNLILIPQLQAMGAVIGTIFAEITRCVIVIIISQKALPVLTYIKNSLFFLFNGIAMYFTVQLVRNLTGYGVIPLLIQICSGAAFYLAVSAVYLYLTKDSFFIGMMKRIFRKAGN